MQCRGRKREAVEEAVSNYGARGIRTLAVARTEGDDDTYNFAALLTFLDPPRPDTKDTIHEAYAYGIDVKMITGDQARSQTFAGSILCFLVEHGALSTLLSLRAHRGVRTSAAVCMREAVCAEHGRHTADITACTLLYL